MKQAFKLQTYQISVTAPIEWTDEQSQKILDKLEEKGLDKAIHNLVRETIKELDEELSIIWTS